MTTKTAPKPATPPTVPADAAPEWAQSWSLGLPLSVAHAGDAYANALAAGANIPAPIVEAVRVAHHVSRWHNDAQRIGTEAEATWREQATTAARNLDTLPPLDGLVTAKAARDVDGLAAGILKELTREFIAAAYRAVRDHTDDLVTYGLRPVWADTLDDLERIATQVNPIVVDESVAMSAGPDTAAAWIEATPLADRYWTTMRARSALTQMTGTDPRDPEAWSLVGRNVTGKALRSEPPHAVARALHRARTRHTLDMWMPTATEYRAHLDRETP